MCHSSIFLGIAWTKFDGKIYLIIVFDRYFLYIDRDVINQKVEASSIVPRHPSPHLSPIVHSCEQLFQSSVNKSYFCNSILCFSPLAEGLLVSTGENLEFLPHPDSLSIMLDISEGETSFKIIKVVSLLMGSHSLSFILLYLRQAQRFLLVKFTFHPDKVLPSIQIVANVRSLQLSLMGIDIELLTEPIVTLVNSTLYIFLSNPQLSTISVISVNIDTSDTATDSIIEKPPFSVSVQAILAVVDGQLTQNEFVSFCTFKVKPIFPQSIGLLLGKKGEVFFLHGGKFILVQLPLPIDFTHHIPKINVYFYDHRIVFIVHVDDGGGDGDGAYSAPLVYDFDLISKIGNTLASVSVDQHLFLNLYKFLIAVNCFVAETHVEFVFRLLNEVYHNTYSGFRDFFSSSRLFRELITWHRERFQVLFAFFSEELEIVEGNCNLTTLCLFSDICKDLLRIDPFKSNFLRKSIVNYLEAQHEMPKNDIGGLKLLVTPIYYHLFPIISSFINNLIDVVSLTDFSSPSSIKNFLSFSYLIVCYPYRDVKYLQFSFLSDCFYGIKVGEKLDDICTLSENLLRLSSTSHHVKNSSTERILLSTNVHMDVNTEIHDDEFNASFFKNLSQFYLPFAFIFYEKFNSIRSNLSSFLLLFSEKSICVNSKPFSGMNSTPLSQCNLHLLSPLFRFFKRDDILMMVEGTRIKDPTQVRKNYFTKELEFDVVSREFSLETMEKIDFFKLDSDQWHSMSFFDFPLSFVIYLTEPDLFKIQNLIILTVMNKKAAMPSGLLFINNFGLLDDRNVINDISSGITSIVSRSCVKIFFSTHSTSPTFEIMRQKQNFEFLLCVKITLELKRDVDFATVLALKPKPKLKTFTSSSSSPIAAVVPLASFSSLSHWAGFLFGLGLKGVFYSLPSDLIVEFVSALDNHSTSASTFPHSSKPISVLSDISTSTSFTFLISAGISLIGSKDKALSRSTLMHFPSLVFSNHLNLANEFGSIFTHPIIDLPCHTVVISALICAGLLYAQSSNLQLCKVFLNELLLLFSISTSSSQTIKSFSFRNSGACWYWSPFCRITKVFEDKGKFKFDSTDHQFSSQYEVMYGPFQPITNLNSDPSIFALQYGGGGTTVDNHYYPYYLSRIKGFSIEGHSFASCFSLGLSLFSISGNHKSAMDYIFYLIFSHLFLSNEKSRLIELNHPTISSPLLIALCMSSFNRSSLLMHHAKMRCTFSQLIFQNKSIYYNVRSDILFNLFFYWVNSALNNQCCRSSTSSFDDICTFVPADSLWLLEKIGVDVNIDLPAEFDIFLSSTFILTGEKFKRCKTLLYSCSFLPSYSPSSSDDDVELFEISAKFNPPVKNPFFISYCILSSLTILIAYLYAKVLHSIQYPSGTRADISKFLYYLVGFYYHLIDIPFYVLESDGLINEPTSFMYTSFHFKSICSLLVFQFEWLITICSLAHLGKGASSPAANFLSFLQTLNLKADNIHIKNKNSLPRDVEDLFNSSVLRSFFNTPRFFSCVSRSFGYLAMNEGDLDFLKYPIAFPLIFIALHPISDEVVEPELGFPDLHLDAEEPLALSYNQSISWDRLPLFCRYFFLRLCKPSPYLTATIGEPFAACADTITASNVSDNSYITLEVRDVYGGGGGGDARSLVGLLESHDNPDDKISVPNRYPLTSIIPFFDKLFSFIESNDGGGYRKYYSIYFHGGEIYGGRVIIYVATSTLSFSPPSLLHNISFPLLPLRFSPVDFLDFGPLLRKFYGIVSHKLETNNVEQFFDELIVSSNGINYGLTPIISDPLSTYKKPTPDGDRLIQSMIFGDELVQARIALMLQLSFYLYAHQRLGELDIWISILGLDEGPCAAMKMIEPSHLRGIFNLLSVMNPTSAIYRHFKPS